MRHKIFIAVLIILAVFALGIPSAFADGEDGIVRVKISVGTTPTEVPFLIDGNYTVEGFADINLERQLYTVKLQNGKINLYYGSTKLCGGTSLKLVQHTATEGNNFIFLHNTYQDNYFGYLGDMEFRISSSAIQVINHVYIEDYLLGVVPYEMNDTWPVEALKAQAVAARNYVLRQMGGSDAYDVVDTPTDQVYKGYTLGLTNAKTAVNETAGKVLTHNSNIIEMFYSASNGGYTEIPQHIWSASNPLYPYQQIKPDTYDLLNSWSLQEILVLPKAISDDEPITYKYFDSGNMIPINYAASPEIANVIKCLKDFALLKIEEQGYSSIDRIAGINSITPSTYIGNHSMGDFDGDQCVVFKNAAINMTVYAKKDETSEPEAVSVDIVIDMTALSDDESPYFVFDKYPGLRLFTIEETETSWNINHRRYGHGVGLSQRGAQQRAKDVDPEISSYEKILEFYYPSPETGTVLTSLTYNRPELNPITVTIPDHSNASVIMINDYSPIKVREKAGTASSINVIGKLPVGARIQVVEPYVSTADGYSWHKILYGTQYAFVIATYIQLDGDTAVDTSDVTFEMNGGNTKPKLTVVYGSSILYAPAGTRTGYTLEGWYSDPDRTNKVTFPYIVTGDTTLYANWTITTYTISYNLDGGKVASENPPSYTIETPEFALVNPMKVGYEFTGWTGTSLSAATPNVTVPAGSYGNRSYTANWKPISLTIASAISSGYDSVTLNWNPVAEEDGYQVRYEVWRSTSSAGSYTRIGNQAETSLTDKGLKTGTIYYYKVRACYDGEASTVEGGFSVCVSVKPLPSAPAAVSASAYDYDSINVKWSAVNGASGYMLYRSTSETGSYSKIATTSSTSYMNNGVSTGTPYYYKVCAYRGTTSIYGGYSTVTLPVTANLLEMENVAVATYYPTSIKISWKAVPGSTGYDIYRSVTEGVQPIYYKSTSSTYINDTGLTIDNTYYYQVRAYRTVSGKKITNTLSSVKSDTARVFKVSSPKAVMYSVTSNKISWSSVTGASGYEIIRCDADGGNEVPLPDTAYTYCYDNNLTPAQTNYYKIRAFRKVGTGKKYGLYSDIIAVDGNVNGVKAVSYTITSSKITWNAVSGRDGYEIWRSLTQNGEDFIKIVPKSTTPYTLTSYIDTGLATDTTYYYKVLAYDTVNGVRKYSGFSDMVSAKPSLNTVSGAKAARYNSTKIKLTWGSVTSATGYEIQRCTTGLEADFITIKMTDTTTASYYDAGLSTGKKYYYRIRAYRISGANTYYGDWSQKVYATP